MKPTSSVAAAIRMILAALCAAGVGVSVGHAQEPGGATATVQVSSVDIGEDLTGAVVVSVADVVGLYGADVQLQYDPTLLEAVDANPGKSGIQIVLGTFLSTDLVVRDSVEPQTGTVHFAATQLNPAEPRDGSGDLFSIVFRGKKSGATAAVVVTSATLADRNGQAIPSQTVDGVVRIVAPSAAPATPTDAPIRVPTLEVPTAAGAGERPLPAGTQERGARAGVKSQASPTPQPQSASGDETRVGGTLVGPGQARPGTVVTATGEQGTARTAETADSVGGDANDEGAGISSGATATDRQGAADDGGASSGEAAAPSSLVEPEIGRTPLWLFLLAVGVVVVLGVVYVGRRT